MTLAGCPSWCQPLHEYNGCFLHDSSISYNNNFTCPYDPSQAQHFTSVGSTFQGCSLLQSHLVWEIKWNHNRVRCLHRITCTCMCMQQTNMLIWFSFLELASWALWQSSPLALLLNPLSCPKKHRTLWCTDSKTRTYNKHIFIHVHTHTRTHKVCFYAVSFFWISPTKHRSACCCGLKALVRSTIWWNQT